MPWCGTWGTTDWGLWWLMPLLGLVFMGVMAFLCFRGFGYMSGPRCSPGEMSDLKREFESLREEIRKLPRQPG